MSVGEVSLPVPAECPVGAGAEVVLGAAAPEWWTGAVPAAVGVEACGAVLGEAGECAGAAECCCRTGVAADGAAAGRSAAGRPHGAGA
ncbi:hypothetical protein O1L68_21545 [Streptomyces lydicus]|nr:hypothetical protein [Streptomyces lydicus]